MKPLPATISSAYFRRPGHRISAVYCAEHVVVADHVPSTGFRPLDAADAARVSVASKSTPAARRRMMETIRLQFPGTNGAALNSPAQRWLLDYRHSSVLDRDFFRREFPQKVQGFSDERESVPVRVVISTVGGRDFDIQRMTSNDSVATLYTREDRMIFVPYSVSEHIQVSVAEDRRVPGFEIRTDSDDGT